MERPSKSNLYRPNFDIQARRLTDAFEFWRQPTLFSKEFADKNIVITPMTISDAWINNQIRFGCQMCLDFSETN